MNFICEIKREMSTDVVVIGGGTAGVFAAIAAAKSGAKTILIEKNSIPGGTMTVANVNFPGLFFAWGKQIINGPCWEAVERTINMGGGKMPEITFKPERHWHEQIRLNRFVFVSVLFQMCDEAGVKVICNSMISEIEENDNNLKLIITGKDGLFAITAKKAIDATGDANLVQIAGYEVEKSELLQPATLQNHISGYDIANVSADEIKKKFYSADLPEHISADNLMSYLRKQKIDMHIRCGNADTSAGKTELDKKAFNQVLKVFRFYRNISGLENIEIDFVAEETGVRETNRIVGESTITAEDYINGVFYPDSVCYAFYPVDRHIMKGIEQVFHKENVVAKIPYSALIPNNSKHILCAGRCISSDTYANSAVRVEATCMATGQAAGCAAALAAKNNQNVKLVSYSEICKALKAINAIVPQNIIK
ncbi:MAG: FAD-dependent oxidoreductase [Clostridia bacterium]|nr:FAD-dependent oxidoreductase [Clostridia bacterium]